MNRLLSYVKKIFTPFEVVTKSQKTLIVAFWLIFVLGGWTISSMMGDTHLFPTPSQVGNGYVGLYNEGLMVHLFNSLGLFLKATIYAIVISLTLVYLSPLPIIAPIANFVSKFRFLPLTGISYYLAILINDGRAIQVWILVIFMSTFLVTSLMSVMKGIDEDINHARTLGCTRWEILSEVVIKGRFDYVIESIRQNLAIVWMSLVIVESILVSQGGLGFLIKNSDKFMDHGRIISLQSIILLTGLGLDYTLTKIRKLTFRYSNF